MFLLLSYTGIQFGKKMETYFLLYQYVTYADFRPIQPRSQGFSLKGKALGTRLRPILFLPVTF